MGFKRRVGQCNRCGGCCQDFAIDVRVGSTTDYEFTDYIKWLTCHEGVEVSIKSFKGRDIEMLIRNPCKYLRKNDDGKYSCAIQDEKPDICKRYPTQDFDDEVSKNCGFKFE